MRSLLNICILTTCVTLASACRQRPSEIQEVAAAIWNQRELADTLRSRIGDLQPITTDDYGCIISLTDAKPGAQSAVRRDIPNDPFNQSDLTWTFSSRWHGEREPRIEISGGCIRVKPFTNGFILFSSGPDRDDDVAFSSIQGMTPDTLLITGANPQKNMPLHQILYDPTNGTISGGDIIYTYVNE